jgi:Uma2 family endonuclease
MDHAAINARRWKRIEYDRLIESGFFRSGDPVELLGGQRIVPRAAFGRGSEVRGRGPLALDDESEPEPDLAVAQGSFRDYQTAHPSRPVLVVEISETGLAFDREHKGSLYARAGLAEVYRDPEPDPAAPFGWRYRSVTVLGPGASIAPLALPGRRIAVANLLL